MNIEARLLAIFEALLRRFGRRHWWPGDTPFEVAIGAILTQNTAWRNVERAIAALKEAGLLDARRMQGLDESTLSSLIRPAGYFNVKARRVKAFVRFLCDRYDGSMDLLALGQTAPLRQELLIVHGIGKETADSILLYALGKPVFVIDAYTRRFLAAHGLMDRLPAYDDAQRYFMGSLPPDVDLFNEYHALLVKLGQEYCRRIAACEGCPLASDLGILRH